MEPRSIEDKYKEILGPWLNGDFEDLTNRQNQHYKHKNPKTLAEKALEYFIEREMLDLPITYIGLTLHCGYHSRSALDYVMKQNQDFESLIKTFKMIVENYNLDSLYGKNFRGANFLLKTNYGYIETTHQIIENKEINIDVNPPKDED